MQKRTLATKKFLISANNFSAILNFCKTFFSSNFLFQLNTLEIRFYTSGYPYLVSRICLLIERDLNRNWTLEGVQEAIKIILDENSALFDDLFKKVQTSNTIEI